MRKAICADMPIASGSDPFFPEKGQNKLTLKAQTMCMNCPVFFECREYNHRTKPEYGTLGAEPSKRGQ